MAQYLRLGGAGARRVSEYVYARMHIIFSLVFAAARRGLCAIINQ